LLALLTACRIWAQAPDEPLEELVGTLESGWMANGGEHTGWVLKPDGDPTAIEVDISCCESMAMQLDGQRVALLGRWADKQYVERGAVRVLVAHEIGFPD